MFGKRQTLGDNAFDAVIMILGIGVFIIMAYPLYFVLIASFSDITAVNSGMVWFWPPQINLEGYRRVFEDGRIWPAYRNTVFYTAAGTFTSLLFTMPAAYALSRRDLAGRNVIMMYFVITMFFSGGLIPTYLRVYSFGLTDTIWVVLIPFSVSAYNLIIARTYFSSTIPLELLEAAKIDGCSNTRFFISVVLPLSKAILAVIGLYCAVGQWNQFFTSMVYMRRDELMPLQVILRRILLLNSIPRMIMGNDQYDMARLAEVIKYAIIIVSTVPVMCFYPFIQKYFTKGVMIGSLKG
jgi:putative aldouronate transport system permease protein